MLVNILLGVIILEIIMAIVLFYKMLEKPKEDNKTICLNCTKCRWFNRCVLEFNDDICRLKYEPRNL